MIKTPAPKKPKKRVRAEERRLRSLEFFQKNKAMFDRERQMRSLRDARSQAEALETYLATLNPAYRQAADADERLRRLQGLAAQLQGADPFRGRAPVSEVLQAYPVSYPTLQAFAAG